MVCICAIYVNECVSIMIKEIESIPQNMKTPHGKGFTRVYIFVTPLTVWHFTLGSVNSAPGFRSSLILDPD